MILAIAAALTAAACYAFSSALHQRAAKREKSRQALNPRLLLRLFRSRLWLLGWIPDTAGGILHAVALRFGPLALVQPLLASGLFMAVLIEAALGHRPAQRRDLLAVIIGAGGLAAFLLAADVRAGITDPATSSWLVVGVAAGSVVAVAVLASLRLNGAQRGAVLGVATGVTYGVGAALLKAVVGRYHGDLLAVLLNWRFPALILVALVGLLLNQNAFQSGRLAAPLTAITLTDPVTSVVIGVTVFRETLSLQGPRIIVLCASVVAIMMGMWMAGAAPGDGTKGNVRSF